MTTATLPAPVRPDVNDDGPEVCHLVCCDPDTALCGRDITDDTYDPHSTKPECPLCALVLNIGRPCEGYPECPLRGSDA